MTSYLIEAHVIANGMANIYRLGEAYTTVADAQKCLEDEKARLNAEYKDVVITDSQDDGFCALCDKGHKAVSYRIREFNLLSVDLADKETKNV